MTDTTTNKGAEGAAAEAQTVDLGEFQGLLEKDFRVKDDESEKLQELVRTLAQAALEKSGTVTLSSNAMKSVKSLIAGIDQLLTEQMDEIVHDPRVQELEGTWRGLHHLVTNTETDEKLKIRVFNIKKEELGNVLKDYEGQMWDQSPIYKRLYMDEYSTDGGEPYGAVIGAYSFSHKPSDISLLTNISGVCAAAHAPFIAAAAPELYGMSSWEELPDPQDLASKISGPTHASYRGLRMKEDTRYVGLTLPRFLGRLPYGEDTVKVDGFAYEEKIGGKHQNYCWLNAAFAMGVNINRSHKLYGWGTQIRGTESGGAVTDLKIANYETEDGTIAMKCPTEVSIDDRREKELADLGMIPLIHRKNSDVAVFRGAQSLQNAEGRAGKLVDPDAQANERLSANLPYLFAVNRFAHYLKAIARDKVGTFKERSDMQKWLSEWINRYVLANPAMAGEEAKAKRPLASAEVQVDSVEGRPGWYKARFYLRPHYQLEGISASLRLVSELPSAKG